MRKTLLLLLSSLSIIFVYSDNIQKSAKWITSSDKNVNSPNTWIAFRKDIQLNKKPDKAITQIAVDSKYWLWINGKLIVFEGGVKRGPNPNDTYYDEIDLAAYLKKGENKIAVLVWYFGKEGFSHKDSKKAGLIFNMKVNNDIYTSDSSWKCRIHPAFEDTGEPYPNFRLPESNIKFNANNEIENWKINNLESFIGTIELGEWGAMPWNHLEKRIIPQWKNFGIKQVDLFQTIKGNVQDTLIYRLPYNMQMTPLIDISDNIGNQLIELYTDHTFAAGSVNIRAEYVTKKGQQDYESLGWMNGHKLILVVPHGIQVNRISYRETGYNSSPEGEFYCDSDFYMRFWDKALRTLYVNMRDTFYDCPERERAQWWGDAVLLMAECFYTHSIESHALMKKGILELIAWQKENGVIYSPIPAGNWEDELPGQMLASVGWYGFWNYYMNTGDIETIHKVYPGVKKYLSIWKLDETGLTAYRSGGWTWGDWGDNKDIRLIFAGWHSLALKAAKEMAIVTGNLDDVKIYEDQLDQVKIGFNNCWNGSAYRHPDYHDKTDDRVQALAVLAGIADEEKYDGILKIFKSQYHASPYMEKYVMEALIKMNQGEFAMERTKERYSSMVENSEYTTLFEGWDIGEKGFGGGTVNHAWSGGPLINIAKEICGIYPLEPGYKVFKIEPNPICLTETKIVVPSIVGEIKSHFKSTQDFFELSVSVPKKSTAIIYLPVREYKSIIINGKSVISNKYQIEESYKHEEKIGFQFPSGNYHIIMK